FAGRSALARARQEADQLRENGRIEATNKAKEIELTARQQMLKVKEQVEREHETARKKLEEYDSRLAKREDGLDRKLDTLAVKERNLDVLAKKLSARERTVQIKEQQLEDVLKEQRERLLNLSGMSPDQAKEMLLKRIEDECKREAGAIIQK